MVAVYKHRFQCKDCEAWHDDCGFGRESKDALKNRGEVNKINYG